MSFSKKKRKVNTKHRLSFWAAFYSTPEDAPAIQVYIPDLGRGTKGSNLDEAFSNATSVVRNRFETEEEVVNAPSASGKLGTAKAFIRYCKERGIDLKKHTISYQLIEVEV